MNLNNLATEITLREGKSESLNIAQVKEVLHILSEMLAERGIWQAFMLARALRQRGLHCKHRKDDNGS